ncbi:hypothetical protein QN277_009799 [Acacia crassicarpa]|uniref:Membralin n=1 Tax=Acacia crassicarpa TaxID=499986 RepID=A0AAE1IRP0_9FABA|nr:hypothetical protein QN277_009799 [Acacia crassicarpa]
MDPEHTIIRVQERFSQMLTPKGRAAMEYLSLFAAITLFCILVVMHTNYVQQPGCSSEFTGVVTSDAQPILIKIISVGLWLHNESDSTTTDAPDTTTVADKIEVCDVDRDGMAFLANWVGSCPWRGKSVFKFWKTDTEFLDHQAEISMSSQNATAAVVDTVVKVDKEESRNSFSLSAKVSLKAAIVHFGKKWYKGISFVWRLLKKMLGSFQKLWNIAGIHLDLDIPKWMHILHLDKLSSSAVQWLENWSKAFEPAYLYTTVAGFSWPEIESLQNSHTVNISISARHPCFGNRWQQLLINRVVGYDTILMNSLLTYSGGRGYFYNYQTDEVYNLSYVEAPPEGLARFVDYPETMSWVLMLSLFLTFTTTMSLSFIIREIQTHARQFTVQLRHHAQGRLPTVQPIFALVTELLIFVPIMAIFSSFLFYCYDDELIAFTVMALVWLCELFALVRARPPVSMKLFICFYSMAFHIYFFSYEYGFSYLALSTTACFMLHLISYYWNRFELPALQRFMLNRRSQLQDHPDFHTTSSTILGSTLHMTRLNTRNQGIVNADLAPGAGFRPVLDPLMPQNKAAAAESQGRSEKNPDRTANPEPFPGQPDLQQPEAGRGS